MNVSTYSTILKYTAQKRGLWSDYSCHTPFLFWASFLRPLANGCQLVVDPQDGKRSSKSEREGWLNGMGCWSGNVLMGSGESSSEAQLPLFAWLKLCSLWKIPLGLSEQPQKETDPQNQPGKRKGWVRGHMWPNWLWLLENLPYRSELALGSSREQVHWWEATEGGCINSDLGKHPGDGLPEVLAARLSKLSKIPELDLGKLQKMTAQVLSRSVMMIRMHPSGRHPTP